MGHRLGPLQDRDAVVGLGERVGRRGIHAVAAAPEHVLAVEQDADPGPGHPAQDGVAVGPALADDGEARDRLQVVGPVVGRDRLARGAGVGLDRQRARRGRRHLDEGLPAGDVEREVGGGARVRGDLDVLAHRPLQARRRGHHPVPPGRQRVEGVAALRVGDRGEHEPRVEPAELDRARGHGRPRAVLDHADEAARPGDLGAGRRGRREEGSESEEDGEEAPHGGPVLSGRPDGRRAVNSDSRRRLPEASEADGAATCRSHVLRPTPRRQIPPPQPGAPPVGPEVAAVHADHPEREKPFREERSRGPRTVPARRRKAWRWHAGRGPPHGSEGLRRAHCHAVECVGQFLQS